MRKISAHYILNPGEKPIKNGILEIEEDGTILNIRSSESIKEEDHLEFYSGVIVPGFVNVHCHLELSHLKNQINEKSGIGNFVDQVISKRNQLSYDTALVRNQIYKMHQTGTQALGDISNTNESLKAKIDSPLIIHTFIELFGLNPSYTEEIWDNGIELLKEFRDSGLSASLTPHAPYSVSSQLWNKFKEQENDLPFTLSLHNQESKDEELFMSDHSGPLAEKFLSMGFKKDNFPGPAKSSPAWYQKFLPKSRNLLLIHNTLTTDDDIRFILESNPEKEVFFGLCPNSNKYIEDLLPTNILRKNKELNLCFGTDSLASNHQLSIWEEIKTVAKAISKEDISLDEYISMATINGARALGIDDQIGSFAPGKNPGIILLEGIQPDNLQIQENSESRRII